APRTAQTPAPKGADVDWILGGMGGLSLGSVSGPIATQVAGSPSLLSQTLPSSLAFSSSLSSLGFTRVLSPVDFRDGTLGRYSPMTRLLLADEGLQRNKSLSEAALHTAP
ncbi:hypothetical protein FHG87_002920, partial [Trinorchestia longiramus]